MRLQHRIDKYISRNHEFLHTDTGEHTMFKKIINWFVGTPQTDLERYIVSKNPQNPAEVDHWLRQYDYMVAASRWI